MFKDFGKNFKNYFSYLMTVNFKELFINTVILFCIIVLSAFVFVPVGIVQDLVRSMVTLVTPFSGKGDEIFNFVFLFISTVGFFLAFIYLFNKRFYDLDAFKNQVKDEKTIVKKTTDKETKDDEFEMPKAKNEK